MSGSMVRATLREVDPKTQTRRIFKEWNPRNLDNKPVPADLAYLPDFTTYRSTCPFGQPGDRLWVRETWARTKVFPGTEMVVFRERDNRTDYGGPWRPGIHLFRRDARIILEITGVRVERLQDISEADAQAEGTPCYVCGGPLNGRSEADCHCYHRTAKVSDFRGLWESINGTESWAATPWVWVIAFKRLEA